VTGPAIVVGTLGGSLLRRALVSLVLGTALAAVLAPPAATAPVPALTFAAWNVCKLDCPYPAPSWDVRRDRVGRVITTSGADVVAVNEATNNRVGSRTQWDDIRALVAESGYSSPVIQDDRCARTDCDNTARLLFKRSTVDQLDFGARLPSAGSWPIGDIAPAIGAYPARQVTWAYLKGREGSGAFLAISAHLTNDKSASGEQHRVAFGRALTGWAATMNAQRGLSGAPVVLMGDLNSFDARQPKGVQRVLRGAGWKDAHSAPKRRNVDIGTVNYDISTAGWPAKPIRNASGVASRIDYILYRGPVRATSYEVVVRLLPNGRYDPAFQGSDHNMVRATLAFPAPMTATAGTLDPAEVPAASGPSRPAARPDPAPSAPARAWAAVVVSYDANEMVTGRAVPVTYRVNDGMLEVLLDGSWTQVPYSIDDGVLRFVPQLVAGLGLPADPLGSALPPPGWIGFTYVMVPAAAP
jgi:endonuclease/exonuclease/phosphatase family metal-dependent hydrolase